MNNYLIGYDLNKEGQDYDTLIEQIKNLGSWWHCLDSTWIIRTNTSAKDIRDHLNNYIDDNDELLVVCLTGEGAWAGFSDKCSKWLIDNLNK